ncbi:hypothetical protein M4R22_18000 [Acidovorax sp. GBBC 3334]|uniref:hypothetical protein n=1 Tax=Acidovorax sp. GBBC 3334 TaxID=2940496 RepID=UPI002303FEA4|nr:hypothetical protein [Acidovorax sp. GBBC 3334]MDA8456657.1 hypothetical protein [Acidovorax sp. GBBC 3334]
MLLHRIFLQGDERPVAATSLPTPARSASPWVVLPVVMAREPALRVRQRLHGALGHLLGTYSLSVDAVRPVCTVHLHLRESEVGECMDRIMAALPTAEFGRVNRVLHESRDGQGAGPALREVRRAHA